MSILWFVDHVVVVHSCTVKPVNVTVNVCMNMNAFNTTPHSMCMHILPVRQDVVDVQLFSGPRSDRLNWF